MFSSYSYSYCYVPVVVNGTSACLESIIETSEIAPLVPPFMYNYQCSNVILTSFIPVFIYGTTATCYHVSYTMTANGRDAIVIGYALQFLIPIGFLCVTGFRLETIPVSNYILYFLFFVSSYVSLYAIRSEIDASSLDGNIVARLLDR